MGEGNGGTLTDGATFSARDIVRQAGLPASTGWRKLRRLEENGVIRYDRRIGGSSGSRSVILFSGTREELVELLLRPWKRPPKPPVPQESPTHSRLRAEALAIEKGLRRLTGVT